MEDKVKSIIDRQQQKKTKKKQVNKQINKGWPEPTGRAWER